VQAKAYVWCKSTSAFSKYRFIYGDDRILYYSDAALRYAVDRCLERDRYIVGITVPWGKRNEVSEKLLSMAKNVARYRTTNFRFEIMFENGSIIQYFPPSEESRGRALHLLIVSKDIDDDLLRDVFIPMERRYYKNDVL